MSRYSKQLQKIAKDIVANYTPILKKIKTGKLHSQSIIAYFPMLFIKLKALAIFIARG